MKKISLILLTSAIFFLATLNNILTSSSIDQTKVDNSNVFKASEHVKPPHKYKHKHHKISNSSHHHHHQHQNGSRTHKKRLAHRKQNYQQYNSPNFQYQQNGQNYQNGNYNNQNNNNGFLNQNNRRAKATINIPDNWEKIPYLLQTYNEPNIETQWHLMPHLSNGFLGTTAKNTSLYFNGLYNGYNGRSHRVRIPSMVAVEAEFAFSVFNNDITTYQFDCRRGVYTIETRNNDAIMTQRFYVHRRLKNIIVNEIRVELLATKISMSVDLLNLTQLELNNSYINSPFNPNQYSYYYQKYNPEQMSFEHRVVKEPTQITKHLFANDGIYYLKGVIPQTEVNNNKRQKEVHTYYTNVPKKFEIYPNTTIKTFHFIQSVDVDGSRARSAYEEALRLIQNDPNGLYVSHVQAWEEIWNKAGSAAIQETNYIDANQDEFKLAQRLYVSFYNLYASIPLSFDNQFYGVSPAGLAYGGLKPEFFNTTQSPQFNTNRHVSEGYGGHVMYHQELFILPLISMFNADMSRSIINSRLRRGYNSDSLNVYEQARENARLENYEGLRYPWEQGDYGVDVSQSQDAKKNKIHTSADISYGLRCFLRMTHSNQFLQQSISSDVAINGETYINELAKYWFDRFELDTTSNEYVIRGVSFGERAQSREIDNELYTNYLASLTMDTYKYALELSNKNPYETQNANLIREYDERINKVKQPYDTFRKLYLEYDNFNTAQQNEETFVPFLNYPIQKNFDYSQKKNIYDTYAIQLPNDGKNILTYASYVVGYTELREDQKAKDYFNRMSNHFNGPFQVLSEYSQPATSFNPINTYHYIPGYAAYANAFISAYCGLRVRDFQLDLIYPSENFGQYQGQVTSGQDSVYKPPALNTDVWNITGIAYRGNKLDITYNLRLKSVEIRNRRANDPLVSADDSLEVAVYEGSEQVIKQLRVGDSVSISLSSELWYYNPKKSRAQNTNGHYTNNIHILASIYSSQYRKNVRLPNSANGILFSPLLMLIVLIFNFKLFF